MIQTSTPWLQNLLSLSLSYLVVNKNKYLFLRYSYLEEKKINALVLHDER